MKRPKVVIYMSCYNHEKYVREAMDSIVGQTYTNWELYVVNDASTDMTGEILSTYQDERIHYFDFKVNTKFIGAANFLQKLLRDVEADYIATMSSDDKWALDKLEKQIGVLTQHPEYKACFTWDKIIFDTEGGTYWGREAYSHKANRSRYDWISYFFYHGNCLNACSMLMDKQLFYELGQMNENYIQLGDYRLWLKLVSQYPFYLIEEELTYYRRHETNLSEPTMEVFIRNANERYRIANEIITSMSSRAFHRAFYEKLPYVNCNSEEELWAEKFILLAELRAVEVEQAAIDIYFNHCANEKFIEALENKYHFMAQDFLDLTGNGGLQYNLAVLFEHPVFERKERNIYSAAAIFLNILDAGKMNIEMLSELRYSVLISLYDLVQQYEGGEKQFRQIKELIDRLRRSKQDMLKEKKLLFIVAEDSEWDVLNGLEKFKNEATEVAVAFVPSKKEYFSEKKAGDSARSLPEAIQSIHLYDETEHCIRFLDEMSERADVIWYVDCLDEDYECGDMIAGYALETEHKCILNEAIYSAMTQYKTKSLEMMSEIQIYR